MDWRRVGRGFMWIAVALSMVLIVFVGLFVATFAWWYQDIDGPLTTADRLPRAGAGLAILTVGVLGGLWCYRYRGWLIPRFAREHPSHVAGIAAVTHSNRHVPPIR